MESEVRDAAKEEISNFFEESFRNIQASQLGNTILSLCQAVKERLEQEQARD